MGVTLVKFLESAGKSNRALYYLDNGESDLPILYDDPNIDIGSLALCPKNGMKWFLNSEKIWARSIVDIEGISHSCHGGSGSGGASEIPKDIGVPTIIDLTVSPAYVEVKPGNVIQFIADINGSNLTTEDVIWSVVSTSAVHQDTKISKDGVLTIAAGQRKAKIEVQALAKDDMKTVGTGIVQVILTGADPGSKVTGILISPKTLTQAKGNQIQFKAELSGIGDFDEEVDWEVLGATDTTVDADGVITIGAKELSPALIVKVSSRSNPEYTSSGTLIVTKSDSALIPTSVEISPKEVEIKRKTKLTLTANIQGPDEISQELIWSIISPFSSDETYISSNGTLVIGEDETQSSVTVKAASCQNPLIFDTATYNILPEVDPGTPDIITVHFVKKPLKVEKGGTAQYIAVVTGKNIKDESISYEVANYTSEYTKISDSGILYIGTEEQASSLLITAIANEDPTVTDVTVVIIDEGSSSEEKESTKYVPEVKATPANTFYLRGVDEAGDIVWKPASEVIGVEEAPTSDLGATYVRKTTPSGVNVWEKINPVDEAPNEGVEKMYARKTNADGTHEWVEITGGGGGIPDAPTDVEGAQYIRKTVDGENIWERFFGGDGIPSMTAAEWNALAPENRPPLANIIENWYRPIRTYTTDKDGFLY